MQTSTLVFASGTLLCLAGCPNDPVGAGDTEDGSSSSTSTTANPPTSATSTTDPGSTTDASTTAVDTNGSSSTGADGSTSSGGADSSSSGDASSSGEGSTSTGETILPQLVAVGHGRFLSLYDVSEGVLNEVATAEIPADGLTPYHQIFGATVRPGEQAIYTVSAVGSNDEFGSWGDGRVDRFEYDAGSLTHIGAAFTMDEAASMDGMTCAGTGGGKGSPIGSCAPVGVVFAPAGDRLYVDDDSCDCVQIFSVQAPGTLTFLDEGGSTYLHGLLADTTMPRVYNGLNIIGVEGDVAEDIFLADGKGPDGGGGNGTELLKGHPGELITTLDNTELAVFTAGAESTTVVSQLEIGPQAALDQAHNADGSLIILGGRNVLSVAAYDGTDLSLLGSQTFEGENARTYREVTFAGENDEYGVLAFFRQPGGGGGGGGPIVPGPVDDLAGADADPVWGAGGAVPQMGGVTLVGIDPATGMPGMLEEIDFVDMQPGRVVLNAPLLDE